MRLALFKDSKKLPLRRDEINELVFTKKHSKKRGLFQEVLDEATTILKDVFGFDLVELPKITSQKDGKKKPSQMPSNQWILRLAEGESKELLEKRCTELQRDCDIPMMGLLMVILSLIQSNNEILEEGMHLRNCVDFVSSIVDIFETLGYRKRYNTPSIWEPRKSDRSIPEGAVFNQDKR